MEVVCAREDLIFGVRAVGHALATRSSMPILGGIRLQARSSGLELAATDLERAIRCQVPARVSTEGTAVCPGQVLSQLSTRLPEDAEVTLSESDGQVRLQCGEAAFELHSFPEEEFPQVPQPPDSPLCRIPRDQLMQAITQTSFAALKASETTRLALTGVDLLFTEEGMKFAATNGYRLAVKRVSASDLPENPEGSFLIDAQSLGDLQRVLANVGAEEVVLYEDQAQLHFEAGPVLFTSRLVQEQFPDFQRVIPSDSDLGLFLPREPLLETLRRMEITAAEESGAVTFKVTEKESAVEISSASKEKGTGKERVRVAKPAEKNLEIAFRAEYLIDALRRMSSDQVALWLSASDRAGLLEPSEDIAPGDEGFIYVCMPVRLI